VTEEHPKEIVAIDIGCGRRRRPGVIGIDQFPMPSVDIVTDLERGLPFLQDSSVDLVYCDSFLEHVDNYVGLMRDIHRVCKPGALIRVNVPHFSNPYYYSDFTHRRFFGLYTFDYMVKRDAQRMKRIVPDYYVEDFRFEIVDRRIGFYSRFKVRRLLKKLLTKLVNLNRYTQEFYEENLCWLFPCYMLKFTLKPVK
jgi:predicted SAM-dependent methyltransferase